MNTPTSYKVIFSGNTLDGHSPIQVVQQFAKAFKLSDQSTLQKLFSGKVITLKRGLSYEQAQRYSSNLQKLGADCCIEPEHNPLLAVTDTDLDNDYQRKKRQRLAYFDSTAALNLELTPK